jgi:hypothetical protein
VTTDDAGGRPLERMRVVVLVGEGVEDLEYWVTVMRLREAGAAVTSVGTTRDEVAGKNGLKARANLLAADVDPAEVDGLVIPGGWAPDKLRRYPAVTGLVRAVHDAGKPIGIICPRRPGRHLRRNRWPGTASHRLARDPRQPGQRRRPVGGRASLPGWVAGVGPGGQRHP